VVYPTGFPMTASNGIVVTENGNAIMLYHILYANHRLFRDQMGRPLLETKIECADGRPVVHGGKPLMKEAPND
jgi:hypothetical protein